MRNLPRPRHLRQLVGLLRERPVVALLGARQVGKTTLARELVRLRKGPCTFFDLEDPRDRAQLEQGTMALERLRGLIVLDEIQRRPDLFPVLRVLADRPRTPARLLVLGSASPDLLRQGSESLAGRIAFHELDGFGLEEVGASWEGFLLSQIITALRARRDECYFWGTHAGAELDLLVVSGRRRLGFEIKRTDTPNVTPSMRSALNDLKLDRLDVIHAGRRTFPLGKGIRAVSAGELLNEVPALRRA
jgi:predicted AAA+ superfamily ATPase